MPDDENGDFELCWLPGTWWPAYCRVPAMDQRSMTMKHYSLKIWEGEQERSFYAPAGLKSEINLLVFVHLLFFILYSVMDWTGMLELPLSDGTTGDLIRSLALSHRIDDMQSHWWTNIFTYQFVHSDFLEFMLSMGLLWLFGNILKTQIGERKVILLYFTCITFSAIAFILSHIVFEIFSSDTGTAEGAFSGTLGVMTACVVYGGSLRLQIYRRSFSLWQIFAFGAGLYLIFFYQHNMAYILMLVCGAYAGYRYAFGRPELARVWMTDSRTSSVQS